MGTEKGGFCAERRRQRDMPNAVLPLNDDREPVRATKALSGLHVLRGIVLNNEGILELRYDVRHGWPVGRDGFSAC